MDFTRGFLPLVCGILVPPIEALRVQSCFKSVVLTNLLLASKEYQVNDMRAHLEITNDRDGSELKDDDRITT